MAASLYKSFFSASSPSFLKHLLPPSSLFTHAYLPPPSHPAHPSPPSPPPSIAAPQQSVRTLPTGQASPLPFPSRSFCSSPLNYGKELDDINSKFAEAREEIEMAMESKETVYFDEEAGSARSAVKSVLDKYDALLSRLPDSEKGAVQRSMGLKMEQLKAELEQLND